MPKYHLEPASEDVQKARDALSNIANADTTLLPNKLIALGMEAVAICNRMASIIASTPDNSEY